MANSSIGGRRSRGLGYGFLVAGVVVVALALARAPQGVMAFVSNNKNNIGLVVGKSSSSSSPIINPAFFLPSPTTTAAKSYFPSRSASTSTSSATQLNMFMGSDGGILGIGTPELVRRCSCRFMNFLFLS